MLADDIKWTLHNARPLLSQAGVSHLAVFGSQVRGDAGRDSDLDVLIGVRDGARFSLLDLVRVEQLLTDATGIKVNALMRRSLDRSLRARIDPDVVEIF